MPDALDQDVRFLAEERIVDALLRALALKQPDLIQTLRSILIDTQFSHSGKPSPGKSLEDQIRSRIDMAADFADQHGNADTR
ncbi:MAG TPA: hypothetical protein VGS12_05410 [Caulobacteraceae bacterium]|nr:hypothetical protein [Caulobacteraceae bacterium]